MNKIPIIAVVVIMSIIINKPVFSQTTKITLLITNVNAHDGDIYAFLWDDAESFPKEKDKFLQRTSSKADSDTVVVVFNNLPTGNYAISVFSDENNNQMFDRSRIRGKIEPFGLSGKPDFNNPPVKFKDCSFTVDTGNYYITLPLYYKEDIEVLRDGG